MSADPDIACLQHFYTTCPAAKADIAANWGTPDRRPAVWTDTEWNEKCGKIIGTYRKKVERRFLVEGIIATERGNGTLAEADVDTRRNELVDMKTKQFTVERIIAKELADGKLAEAEMEARQKELKKLMKTAQPEQLGDELGVTFARTDSEEAALKAGLRDLMYTEIKTKYSADPRDMMGTNGLAGADTPAATTEVDGAADRLHSELDLQEDTSDQDTKAAQAAKAAAELEAQVAEAREDIERAAATESAIVEAQHKNLEALAEETAAARLREEEAVALAAEAQAKAAAAADARDALAVEQASTRVPHRESQAPAVAEPAARQQKADAAVPVAMDGADEDAVAAARSSLSPETSEPLVKAQEMHADETNPEESGSVVTEGIDSPRGQTEAMRTDEYRTGAGIGVDGSPRHDMDAKVEEGKAFTSAVFEQQARRWINAVRESQSQDTIDADVELAEALHDGVILCELLNAIRPEVPLRTSKVSFAQHHRENIGKFVGGCTDLGVPDAEKFETVDLYERGNLMQVWRCIASLAKHTPDNYTGPSMTSEADIRAEIVKVAAVAGAQKAAAETAARVKAEEEQAVVQGRARQEAQAPASVQPKSPKSEPEQGQEKSSNDPHGASDGTSDAALAADENEALLDDGGASTVVEGVPPQSQRRRWWCCADSKPDAYALAGTEDSEEQ